MPRRLSEGPEDSKPSPYIAAFWWIVFIVPVVFLWFAFQSPLLVGIVVVVRILIMFIPTRKKGKEKKKTDTVKIEPKPEPVQGKGNNQSGILTPFIEEARSELGWFKHLFRRYVYDAEREEKYLDDYRTLRGWK